MINPLELVVAIVGVVIGSIALIVAGANLWRAELRGPALRVWAPSGSTSVRCGIAGDDPSRFLVNVDRDVLISNDSARPGYIGDVTCETVGELVGMTVRSLTVGVASEHTVVPQPVFALNRAIERGNPLRVTVTWWLDLAPEDEEAILAQIRAPAGGLAMRVSVHEHRSGRTKRHDLIVRPKSHADELVKWFGSPWGL